MRARAGLRKAFLVAATGRVVWGVLALTAPRLNTRVAGIGDRATPEVHYLVRVFGARALALGLGYLLSDERNRVRWQRLCLVVDSCDTVAGLTHVARGDIRRGTAVGLTLATGGYATLGVAGLLASATATDANGNGNGNGDDVDGGTPE